ncbi:hypothetical protein PNEG_01024 [Pneumocystis murina B123]|uniref:3-hydroxyisobutyryl-CoA hydrolase n=1 Tax=Pneumocystis murina (strain B123) TaxID=1069680 RepID=M7NUB2_PNEMU|nr:hypothetical protein PNEG_01024 [Pneumocystis murina B123]EMR10877.1 hypothetical protein PNEG_01024 [Pneumocystis murina B123]
MKTTVFSSKTNSFSFKFMINFLVFTRKFSRAKMNFPMIETESNKEVLFDSYFGLRMITLNRPKKLNALNMIMTKNIYEKLIEWKRSSLAKIILLRGINNRALSAGGDVVAIAELCRLDMEKGYKMAMEYFELEYRLDYLIATFKEKPYVSLMDGITMGGGAGLSVHAPFRVATENTVFAMPETDIGFFPDAGLSFFLSRMDGEVGKYLGMTSERLYGFDTLISGIATHYVPSERLDSLIARLSELDTNDCSSKDYFNVVDRAIDEFSGEPPRNYKYRLGGETREAIDRCFKYKKIENVFKALKKEGTEWANSTIDTLNRRSPTSIKVALREIQEAKKWNILQAFNNELNITSYLLKTHDFIEGIEAKLVKKPSVKPVWKPSIISEVSDKLVDTFFKSCKDSPQLNISGDLISVQYQDYPYNYGLPTEIDLEKSIRNCISNNVPVNSIRDVVFDIFFKVSPNKPGLSIKLDDILFRKRFGQLSN